MLTFDDARNELAGANLLFPSANVPLACDVKTSTREPYAAAYL